MVTTGLPDPPRLTLLYALRVAGNLQVTPSNPYFNLREPGPKERTLTIRSRRPDFVLRAARVIAGPFQASINGSPAPGRDGSPAPGRDGSPAPGRGAVVRIRVDESAITTDQRGFAGKLLLLSNDPAEPAKEVPLFAMGALNRSDAPAPSDAPALPAAPPAAPRQ